MRLLAIFPVLAVLSAVPAGAQPTALHGLNGGAARPETMEGRIIPANIVGRDDRGSVDEFPDLMNPAEQRWLAAATGLVECPATANFPGRTGSAALAGTNGKILTAAHNFFDLQRRVPNPMPRCYFRSKANPGKRIPLVFEAGSYRIGATFFDPSRDYAVVRLAEPVAGVRPIPLDGQAPAEGNTVILISARAAFARRPLSSARPVARVCTVRRTFTALGHANRFFRGDCDTSAGDSGGLYLARRSGQLVAVGLHHGGGLPAANGLAYDEDAADPARKSYSLGIGFGPVIFQDLSAVP